MMLHLGLVEPLAADGQTEGLEDAPLQLVKVRVSEHLDHLRPAETHTENHMYLKQPLKIWIRIGGDICLISYIILLKLSNEMMLEDLGLN